MTPALQGLVLSSGHLRMRGPFLAGSLQAPLSGLSRGPMGSVHTVTVRCERIRLRDP